MAAADYLLCTVCSSKTVYDAEVDYDTPNLGQIAALCTDCVGKGHKLITYAATPITVAVTKLPEVPTMAALVRADMTGRVALGGEYRNREFSLYRTPSGKIELIPLPMAADDEDAPPFPITSEP